MSKCLKFCTARQYSHMCLDHSIQSISSRVSPQSGEVRLSRGPSVAKFSHALHYHQSGYGLSFRLHSSLETDLEEKREEIWLSPMTKAPTPTEKSKKQRHIKNATKNFDYKTIAGRLRTVSKSNSSHSTGVVKLVYERSTFPLAAKVV